MFPSAYLLIFLGQIPGLQQLPGTSPEQVMRVKHDEAGLTLGWSDAEDRLQGAVSPPIARVGGPLQVSVHVGTFQGAEFDGPVTLSLRPYGYAEPREGEPLGLRPMKDGPPPDVVTVTRGKTDRAWTHTFTPHREGPHVLEVSFRTTRLKVARALVTVDEGRLPTWPWYVIAALAILTAVGVGVRVLFKKDGEPPPKAEAP